MNPQTLKGVLLDDSIELTLGELCSACDRHAEWIIELVEEGILEPFGSKTNQWRFPAVSLQRAQTALRLQNDLGINLAGVALALDLLDEIDNLRAQLCRLGVEINA